MQIILVGLGNVGQGLLTLLRDKAESLKQREGFEARIVGVVTARRGTLYHPDGLDIPALLACATQGTLAAYPDSPALRRDLPRTRSFNQPAHVLVEASPSNFTDAQPALDYCITALESGKHVVMANKGPVALAYADLMRRAESAHKHVLFEGTVMAGTPSIRLAREALRGAHLISARGILNGTTNYILTQMENGLAYADALQQAQALGYAETDPAVT